MNIFKIAGKFLDQPILVAKFEQKVPYILVGSGLLYGIHQTNKTSDNNKKEKAIATGTTLGITLISAITAPKIVNKIFKKKTTNLTEIKLQNKTIIDEFIKNTNPDKKTTNILNKAKENILNIKDIQFLHKETLLNTKKEKLLNKLIPNPENITSKEIFSEIGRLSILGLIPVLGGITGGVCADALTDKNHLKENLPNKIKEGAYQYLANIFLCNVGAGIALGIMEKLGIKSKSTRALGMITGILALGVIGGSFIANIIGNKIINPIFNTKSTNKIYDERKPEALDIGLHIDDIATVAVMSGLKWIEPALPIMYSISGYRAGIGYRNVNKCNK